MPPVTIDGTSGITTPMYGGAITANAVTPSVNMKSRIINGAMSIDQRNAGASVTIGATGQTYTLDRWFAQSVNASKFSVQQNAGSVTPPVGFNNYLGITSLASTSSASTDYYSLVQAVEGFNFADLGWGTANAKTVTLSFQVYSSLTGTFSGSLTNSAGNRSYPFTYTVSSANTWTTATVTIAGDTTGTWVGATNGAGVYLRFDLGMGSNYRSTANSWQAGFYYGVTGSVSVVGTNGATFYLTGVQLEVGSTATSFDYRPYGTELNLCQRYFQIVGGSNTEHFANGIMATTRINIVYGLKQTMRASPSWTATSFGSAYSNLTIFSGAANVVTGTNEDYMSPNNVSIGFTHGGSTTAGQAGYIYFNSTAARVAFSAEL